MGHALRLMLTREQPLAGTVEMDEFSIGGSPRKDAGRPRLGRGRKGQPRTSKPPALAVVQRPASTEQGSRAGEARAHVAADLAERETYRMLREAVDTGAHLMSDQWKAFVSIGQAFARHHLSFGPRRCPRPGPCQLSGGVQRPRAADHRRGFPSHQSGARGSLLPGDWLSLVATGRLGSSRTPDPPGTRWSRPSGLASRPRSRCPQRSSQLWDANCVARAAAGSRSAVPWLSLVDIGGVV
jgi:hypothetical protein